MPRIAIVGAGFTGLSAATALARTPAQIVVIDERNYHLFQLLLYQVATAGLSPADIAAPIRGILRRQKHAHVMLGSVTGIDARKREVILRDRRVAYDYLIVATGAGHAYFGHDEWAAVAPGLKKIDDATRVRRKILIASAVAKRSLERLGVEVRLGARVTHCDEGGVKLGDERIDSRTIVWAAGVAASPAAEWLAARHDRVGRVMVANDLSLPGHGDVFVIGDTAYVEDPSGKPLPGIAPVAKQQGKYVQAAPRAHRRAARAGRVPLSPRRQSRHHRAHRGGRRLRLPAADWADCVAGMGGRAHFVSRRVSQPSRRRVRLAVGLCDIPERCTAHHRGGGGRCGA
jgi:NADH dehydrogenase FAD-containing subunit